MLSDRNILDAYMRTVRDPAQTFNRPRSRADIAESLRTLRASPSTRSIARRLHASLSAAALTHMPRIAIR